MSFYTFTWILLIVAAIIAIIAEIRVKNIYTKYQKVQNVGRISGKDAALRMLSNHGIQNVSVECVGETLADNFDPRNKTVHLSREVYFGTTISAVSIACHEAGHAVQHEKGYSGIKIRDTILPVANFGSKFAIPLVFAGLLLELIVGIFMRTGAGAMQFGRILIMAGICAYAFVVLFQLVTLPVEFNASRRAKEAIIAYGFLSEEEMKSGKKVLSAAAMTYVAGLAMALIQLLRLIVIFGRRR